MQTIATEALWTGEREVLDKSKEVSVEPDQSCFAELVTISCVWSSNKVGEGHNGSLALLSQWRNCILLSLLILCVLLSFLISINLTPGLVNAVKLFSINLTAGLLNAVKLFTSSSFIWKALCRHFRRKMSTYGLLRYIVVKVVSVGNLVLWYYVDLNALEREGDELMTSVT